MILPIYVYGHPVLRKVAEDFELNDPEAPQLVENMYETMYKADGIGLAGPQVGVSKRIFVVDASSYEDEDPSLKDFKKIFLNPHIIEKTGDPYFVGEGCLSLPDMREEIERPESVVLSYYDENWQHHEETFSGFQARVIQHEYDHLEGTLFVDLLSPLNRRLLKSKLSAISKGKVQPAYRIKLP